VRETGFKGADVKFEFVTVGIEKIQRLPLATILLPQRCNGPNALAQSREIFRRYVERDVSIVGMRPRSCDLIEGKTKPEGAGF
jgi:hypothetical protein